MVVTQSIKSDHQHERILKSHFFPPDLSSSVYQHFKK